jgi:lactose/L-arabinose transport system substrate-binding protein
MSSLPDFPSSPRDIFTNTLSRRHFVKSATAATFLGVAGTSLAACGGSTSTGNGTDSGEIVIWDRSGDLYQVFHATIASFNKKYPNIKVKHVAVDISAKLPSTLNTGVNVPDGVFYEDNNLPVLAEHYYDITEWIQPYVKDIVPFKVRVNTVDKKILGIPWDLDPGLLYYREDLCEQAGIDPATITTYDKLLTAAKTMQNKLGPTVKPIHLEQDPGLTQLWVEMFANQQGSSMVDAQGKLRIDSEIYLRILQWLDDVRKQGLGTKAVYYSPGDIAAVDKGQVAFYPWAVWAVYGPELLFKQSKGKWRAMALPAWEPGGKRGAIMGGSSFIIPKKAKNPLLAWRYYEHLVFSPDGYQAVYGPNKIYPGGLNTSLPSYLPALKEPLYKNPPGLNNQNLWEVATKTIPDMPEDYSYPKWYNQAVTYFGANIQRLLDGKMTPQQVLTESTQQIQTKLIDRA